MAVELSRFFIGKRERTARPVVFTEGHVPIILIKQPVYRTFFAFVDVADITGRNGLIGVDEA